MTPTEQDKEYTMTLDGRLDKYAKYLEHDEYHYDCDLSDGHTEYDDDKAKQAVLSDLLELIEDEAVRVPANDMAIAIIRNQLRQELRDKVKEYCK